MQCPDCGTVYYGNECPRCALMPVRPAAPSPTPSPPSRSWVGWLIVLVSFVVVVMLIAIWALASYADEGSEAILRVTGFNYSYDWWSDSIHVWGTLVNDGDGATSSVHSIDVYITVWFDHEPYTHVAYFFDALGPGESRFFDRVYATPFTLDLYVTCSAEITKVAWYNA